MLNEALTLASKGFRLIPCKEKIPIIKKWQINATNDNEKIRQLWNDNYNVGILTGKNASNLVVIDCDIKEDINGIKNFLEYLKRENIILPKTLIATSGRGGKHYYFKSKSSNIKSGTNVFDKGIDIRANGGFIIAPPSMHPNGNAYSWDNDCDIAYLPQPLEDTLLQNKSIEKFKVTKEKKINYIDIKQYSELANIKTGERNDTLFRLASKLIDSGLCYNAIFDAINTENECKCIEPLTKEEVRKIVNSSYKYKCEDDKSSGSISKIFSGKYNTTSIAIYWAIWHLSLKTIKGKIYITQDNLCKMLGLKSRQTLSYNLKPLKEDNLIEVKRESKINNGFGVNSYKIL